MNTPAPLLTPLEARLRLARNGYSPIPINGKIPHVAGWQNWHHREEQVIRLWDLGYRDHQSTGILTSNNPFLDLDIYDPAAAEAAAELVSARFDGQFLPLRIGKAPKRGFLFQLSGTTFPKIIADLIAPDGKEHRIEMLCDKNQVVVHGIHIDTHKPYTWHGGSPFEIKLEELTGITEDDARKLVDEIVELLIQNFGYKRKTASQNGGDSHAPQADHSWDECLNNLIDHDHDVALVMKLQRAGTSDGAVHNIMRALVGQTGGDEDRKVRRLREIGSAVKSGRAKIKETPQDSQELKSIRGNEVIMTAVEWLWPNRFAIGKLGLIAGLPDEGKGQVLCDIISRVSRGADWPCGEGAAPIGNTIVLSAEDDLADTVVPRLASAGADLSRVHFIQMIPTAAGSRLFSLITDLPMLNRKIDEIGNVALLIIDPISAYLGVGKIDTFRAGDVRSVLSPLTELSQTSKLAIIGVMHFNKKIDVTNALLRISDSLAFGAHARHVYGIVDDQNNQRKIMVRAKNNLSIKSDKALAYRFGAQMVGLDQSSGKEIWAPHIIWESQHVDITAGEAMAAAITANAKSPTARDEAKKFLASILAEGPVAKKEIEEEANANGISRNTLYRAKNELQILAKKDNPDGGWRWHLTEVAKTSSYHHDD